MARGALGCHSALSRNLPQTGGLLLRYNRKTQPLLWSNIAPRFTHINREWTNSSDTTPFALAFNALREPLSL